jgi:hypothetical protein
VEVLVFGSNRSGFHGAGSAGLAFRGDSRNTWRSDPFFLRGECCDCEVCELDIEDDIDLDFVEYPDEPQYPDCECCETCSSPCYDVECDIPF